MCLVGSWDHECGLGRWVKLGCSSSEFSFLGSRGHVANFKLVVRGLRGLSLDGLRHGLVEGTWGSNPMGLVGSMGARTWLGWLVYFDLYA